MSTAITRKGFLKRAAGGATGAAVATAALASPATGAVVLDASFTSPYAPYPTFRHPSSWNVYTALIPAIVVPYDVIVCDRPLSTLNAVDGRPDLSGAPTDATMLAIFHRPLDPGFDASRSLPLNGRAMRFGDFGGGDVNNWGFRQFIGWWTATSSDSLYSVVAWVYVGPDAGAGWQDVQSIVETVQVPA